MSRFSAPFQTHNFTPKIHVSITHTQFASEIQGVGQLNWTSPPFPTPPPHLLKPPINHVFKRNRAKAHRQKNQAAKKNKTKKNTNRCFVRRWWMNGLTNLGWVGGSKGRGTVEHLHSTTHPLIHRWAIERERENHEWMQPAAAAASCKVCLIAHSRHVFVLERRGEDFSRADETAPAMRCSLLKVMARGSRGEN